MCDYRNIEPGFWLVTKTALKPLNLENCARYRSALKACYLQTCPSSTMLGLHYVPLVTIAV